MSCRPGGEPGPEHGYHAPNENFDWQQAGGGMVAFAKYLELAAG